MTAPWNVLICHPTREVLATKLLSDQGYEAFTPARKVRTLRPGHGDRERMVALFPGYAFCRLTVGQRLQVEGFKGVLGLLQFGGRIAEVGAEVDALRAVGTLNATPCEFRAGDQVRVIAGPLAGIPGLVVRCKSPGRIVLSVEMLQRSVEVEASPDWLEVKARKN